jgi:hypothetical protein
MKNKFSSPPVSIQFPAIPAGIGANLEHATHSKSTAKTPIQTLNFDVDFSKRKQKIPSQCSKNQPLARCSALCGYNRFEGNGS